MTPTIPGYRLGSQIFQSRHSVVHRATREADGRAVILKVEAHDLPTPARRAAFRCEYELTRGLALPGVIAAYDLFSVQGRLVMVLEDFGGVSVAQWARTAKPSIAQILEVAASVARTLGELHRRHIMHKDVNPSNIVINDETGTVKIIDLGLAAVLSRESPEVWSPDVIEGTLAYISPEQTGRMNRAIDYRTDLYSLGVTLYELLTGALPFDANDPVELVHAHIAKQPEPPRALSAAVPRGLSDVVMKLMAKNAEQRYRSAHGLAADLDECLRRLRRDGDIEPFPLGRDDVSDRFQILQKLYGREEETRTLLDAFERVSAGASELTLVKGQAGIGKSAVVRELYKPITRQRGYFIAGKFDQLQRNVPFASLVEAFQSLSRQILTESAERVAAWREELLAALGQNGQVIIDVIPEIRLIIGPQPPLPALEGREAQNRFNLVFQSFIRVFARREHPLVLFLDDLQWADGASLAMIEVLMTGSGNGHGLIIGAYRDNEVGPSHPLSQTLATIRKAGGTVNEIALGPLPLASIVELCGDACEAAPAEVAPLAELCRAKTDGNPFFLGEFLKSLHDADLISFDAGQRRWRWDMARVAAADITSNVVDLMTGKVKRLPDAARRTLELAASIGSHFDLQTLAAVAERSARDTAADLWPAVAEGLVLPLNDSYRLMAQDVDGLAEAVRAEYKFAHDRVQQAAYAIIPEDERAAVHGRIGRALLRALSAEEQEARLFDIVNHLNQGRGRLQSDAERLDLAHKNLLAGRKAKASTAYGPAADLLKVGVELLGERGWEDHYDLALALHLEAAASSCLAADFAEMDRLAGVTVERAQRPLDKAAAYDVLLQAAIAQNKSREAVETGLRVLSLLGIDVPANPAPEDIGAAMGATNAALAGAAIEGLVDLPEMTDPLRLMEMQINNRVGPPAYRVVPALFPLLTFNTITLLIKHGNNPEAPFSYALYGLMLCAMGDIDQGYRFGQLALALLDRYPSRHVEARTRYLAAAFIGHWKDWDHDEVAPLAEAHRLGLATGDLEFGGFAALMFVCFSYFTGTSLQELERESARYVAALREIKQETPLTYARIHHQAIINLTGQVADPCRLAGEAYDEDAMRPVHTAADDLISFGYGALNKLMLCVLLEDVPRARENADLTDQYLPSLAAMPHVPLAHFYGSLARLAACAGLPDAERAPLLEKVAASQALLETYAGHAPRNHKHKWALVEAERARVASDEAAAIPRYREAIRLAQDNHFPQEEALANEAFGRFWLERGDGEVALVHLSRAHQQYRLWGAAEKVRRMEVRYPALAAAHRKGDANLLPSLTLTTSSGSTVLDLRTVMKASQAISKEIVLAELLRRVMRIVIENAGAERGVLLLARGDRLFIEAEGSIGPDGITLLEGEPAEPGHRLPAAILNYVTRTQETVVLADASREGPFTADPYLKQGATRSVLCTPVVHQGKRIGALYLENNLVTGAFSPDRVEVLGMLSAQAAISLENVMLYRDLERKVEERTADLKAKTIELERTLEELTRMQQQIIVQEKMASLGTLTAGIAHEINNPLNFVINFSNLSHDLAAELRESVDRLPSDTREEVTEVAATLEENLQRIKEHGVRASRIVSTMLAHSTPTSGAPEPTDINALIEQVIELLRYRTPNSATPSYFHVTKTYDAAVARVPVIPQDLSRALMNLLTNARDAVQEKTKELGAAFTPELHVSTRARGGGVEIKIRDNGKGIPAAIRDKIYNPFFTTKPTGQGVGLGLSLAHDIVVRQHRGALSVTTEEGAYTEFTVELPG